jgi:hypothetical protein
MDIAPSIFPWVFGFIKPMLAQNDVPKFENVTSSHHHRAEE